MEQNNITSTFFLQKNYLKIYKNIFLISIFSISTFSCISQKTHLKEKKGYESENINLKNENTLLQNVNSILKNEKSVLEKENTILRNENDSLKNKTQKVNSKANKVYTASQGIISATNDTFNIYKIDKKESYNPTNKEKSEIKNSYFVNPVFENLKKEGFSFTFKNSKNEKECFFSISDEILFNENNTMKNNIQERLESLRSYLSEKEEWHLIISKSLVTKIHQNENQKKAKEIQKYMYDNGMQTFLDDNIYKFVIEDGAKNTQPQKNMTFLKFVRKSEKPQTK